MNGEYLEVSQEEAQRYATSPTWEKNLSDAEKDAVLNYLNLGYRVINEALRSGSTYDEGEIALLDSSIAKGKVVRDLIVFEGVSFDELGTACRSTS